MKKPIVKNLTGRSGNPIPNQFTIYTESYSIYLPSSKETITLKNCRIFQSYNSVVAILSANKTYLNSSTWNCSKTTSRYRTIFLNEPTKETEKKIETGEYILFQQI